MRRHLHTIILAVLAVLAGVAAPGIAADPPSQDGNVPTAAGEEVVLTWTGTVPPGAAPTNTCDAAVTDGTDVTLAVPEGLYDAVRVSAEAVIANTDPLTDPILSITAPDGTVTDSDAGTLGEGETVTFLNPAAGTYTFEVCAFAGGGSTYEGTLTLRAEPAVAANATPGESCPAPDVDFRYESAIIDATRAGGEPIVTTHPDGTLLWGSHAGTTHFFGPAAPDPGTAAFIQNYEGQTYQYFSDDHGATWEFVGRTPINDPASLPGLPASGFSDPEFAIDQAGNVFISEINLANVAVSKSSDSGHSYTLQSLLAIVATDRQWMAADEEDVLYITANGQVPAVGDPLPSGHYLIKSTDGGVTFTSYENPNPNGVSDIRVDPADGDLLEIAAFANGDLALTRFDGIRGVDSGFADLVQHSVFAPGAGLSPIGRQIDPDFDMDAAGNIYAVWSENGMGSAGRAAGVWYAYSRDRGLTFSDPIRVDPDARTEAWPWLTVGGRGQVVISYLQTDAELPNNDAELAGPDDEWHVVNAYTDAGLGCAQAEAVTFHYSQATTEPVHRDGICQGGTVCQAMAVDRRLGDYFANDIDTQGHLYVSVGDTVDPVGGGAVALPRVIRQVDGPDLSVDGVDPGAACEIGTAERVARVTAGSAVELGIALAQGCYAGADAAVIARDDVFADALAASGLAGELDAPVLLNPTGALAPAVAAELQRLGVQRVVLAGGTAALAPQVATDLEALDLDVQRIGGAERFSTAALIGDAVVAEGGPVERAVVALGARPDGGDAWPDALAAGVLAATGRVPVLLVVPDSAPEPTVAALGRLLQPGAEVLVAGGSAAVGDAVVTQLTEAGYAPRRLAGDDRYGTAVAIAEEARAAGADLDNVLLVSGEDFTAALIAGPAAAQAGSVMLLAHPQTLANGPATADYLTEHAAEIGRVLLVGDESALSPTVLDEVTAALEA